MTMINTKKVTNRRLVKFDSLDDIRRDAQELCRGEIQALGNWTPGQVFSHCAQTMNAFLDQHNFQPPPWWARLLGRLIKNRLLNGGMSAGFPLPDPVLQPPAEISLEQGFADLTAAIKRWQSSTPPPAHPFFGSMNRDEWDKLHERHCEMHFSFLKPK